MMKAHSPGVSDYCLCVMMKFIILTVKLRGCWRLVEGNRNDNCKHYFLSVYILDVINIQPMSLQGLFPAIVAIQQDTEVVK